MCIHCFWNPWYIDDGYIATGISWSNLDDRFYSLPLGKIQFGVLRRLSFPNGTTIKNKNSAINNNNKKTQETLKAIIQKQMDYLIFGFGLLKKPNKQHNNNAYL